MPLKLSLKPGERFVLNGAVVENGDRRATLVLQNKASVLREKDIMQEHEADTPAKRIYFPVMMMYLSSSSDEGVYDAFVMRMTEFMGVIKNPEVLKECVTISRDVMAGEYYKALLRCRKLIAYEAERLAGGEASSKS
ncbi:MAG: flagellar biosynthesis repressor FlbT [Alphaproteobacteria bacterium]|nr:flagellar biosynthesis repressor FlbT [Alphaproteobacteria bacterium]